MQEVIRRLVSIPSVTGTGYVNDALEEALKICKEFGFRTKNIKDMLGYAEIGEGDEIIGILCHLDVVPAGDGWRHDPFGCELENGILYGRGVIDDKGPAVASMYAMKDILDSGVELNKRIRIIFGTTEEDGEWYDMKYYVDHEELPSYGFTPDASFPGIYAEKGIAQYRLTRPLEGTGFRSIEGGTAPNMVPDFAKAVLDSGKEISATGKSAHASLPHLGENAISILMENAEAPFANLYNRIIGYDYTGKSACCDFYDSQSGGTTFNVGKVTVNDSMMEMYLDIRYPVTINIEEITEALTKSMKELGFTVALISHDKPVFMDKNGPVITKLIESYAEITGDTKSEPEIVGGGTYARAMDNIVAFGPLLPGREMTEHQKDERISLADLELARKIYMNAIKKLLNI